MKSNCCDKPLIDETGLCPKCKENCEAVLEITAKVTEGAPTKFRQIWLEHKTDELECNVYTVPGETHFVIEINNKPYSIDVSELAGELVEQVIKNEEEKNQNSLDPFNMMEKSRY